MIYTLSELCDYLRSLGMECQLDGDPQARVESVATLESAGRGQISFLSNPKYEKMLTSTTATAVLVRPDVRSDRDINLLRTADPYAAVTACIVKIHGYRKHPQWGRSDKAHIADTAQIGAEANIAPDVSIDEDVIIGDRVTLYPGVYIARGTRIGHDAVLFPNVTVYENCVLGDRVTVHAGSVIGEDGLGYAPVNDKWVKIPQIGNAVLGDDVEIGANCTIDRATLGSTVIGSGSKFSNLIAIGHGTRVGDDCMFVAQVGVAGSVTVGRHVTMAGQVGVVGHITIGDNATVGAKSGVTNSVQPNSVVLGQPAVPITECKRQVAVVQRLPEMRKEINQLKREVDRLTRIIEAQSKS